MNYDLINVLIIFLFYFIFFNKFKFLRDNKASSSHKKFIKTNKSPILIGGFFLVSIVFFFSDYPFFPIKFSLFLIFLLGLSSDKNILISPKFRLIIQLIILFYTVYFYGLTINDLRIEKVNLILTKSEFNLLLTIFCLAILINGSNFIDGLNGLLVGYSIFILISIFYISLGKPSINIFQSDFILILIFALIIFLIVNIFGHIYLGDNGSYVLSFLIGIYLLNFSMENKDLSPYYIASLLWYPAFENFFSFARRLISKRKISFADNFHFHQLMYHYIKNQGIFKKKKELINSLSSFTILIINLPGFIISSNFPFNTKVQISVILMNIIIYLILYYILLKKFFNKQS